MYQQKHTSHISNLTRIILLISLFLITDLMLSAKHYYNPIDDKRHTIIYEAKAIDTDFIPKLDSIVMKTNLKKLPYYNFIFGCIDSCIMLEDGTSYNLLGYRIPDNNEDIYIQLWGNYFPDDIFGEQFIKYKTKYYIFPQNLPRNIISKKIKKQEFAFSTNLIIDGITIQPIVIKWDKTGQMSLMENDTFVFSGNEPLQ